MVLRARARRASFRAPRSGNGSARRRTFRARRAGRAGAEHAEVHVEIAGRTAANAGFAVAGNANARAVVDAGGIVHGEFALISMASAAAADRARLRDHVTFTTTRVAGRLRDELSERSLADGAHDAAAVTTLAPGDERTGLRARSLARIALGEMRELDFFRSCR